MGVICAMTLIRNIKKYSLLCICILLITSCDQLKRAAGIEKVLVDDSLVNQTPDLVLPPEFDLRPPIQDTNSYENEENLVENNISIVNSIERNLTEIPKAKNFVAPQISIPSSPSPSDSIDRFRNNRKFTIGEWVYNQSVNNFKGGNIYFRPLYDKGYNFTRRYVPEPSKNIMPERINIPTSIPGNTINQEKFFSENFVPSSNSISQIPPIE